MQIYFVLLCWVLTVFFVGSDKRDAYGPRNESQNLSIETKARLQKHTDHLRPKC